MKVLKVYPLFLLVLNIFLLFTLERFLFLKSAEYFFYDIFSPVFSLRSFVRNSIYSIKDDYLIFRDQSKVIKVLKNKLEYQAALIGNLQRQNYELNSLRVLAPDINYINNQAPFENVSISCYDSSGKGEFLCLRDKNFEKGYLAISNGYFVGIIYEKLSGIDLVYTVFNPKLFLTVIDIRNNKVYVYNGGFPYGKIINAPKDSDIMPGDPIYIYDPKNKKVPMFFLGKVEYGKESKNPFFNEFYIKPYADVYSYRYLTIIKEKL